MKITVSCDVIRRNLEQVSTNRASPDSGSLAPGIQLMLENDYTFRKEGEAYLIHCKAPLEIRILPRVDYNYPQRSGYMARISFNKHKLSIEIIPDKIVRFFSIAFVVFVLTVSITIPVAFRDFSGLWFILLLIPAYIQSQRDKKRFRRFIVNFLNGLSPEAGSNRI